MADASESAPRVLGEAPFIHPSADVRDCVFGRYCEVGARTAMAETTLGDYSYVVNDADIIYATIGKFSNIAARARLNPGQHPLDRASLHHFQYRSRLYGFGPDDESFFAWRRDRWLTIGHDTWIGNGAVVMGGLTVGTGAVVGANAVVTRDVPPFTIVAGVPARPLRDRFPADIQAALLRIRWWDWPHERLGAVLEDFRRLDAAAFCRKYDPA
jgi:phosphonate metabolism protein (transferase hexapeptide repeat family)